MSVVKNPIYKVIIDDEDVTDDVVSGFVDSRANVIDSYNIGLQNNNNKYDKFFAEELRFIEIWLGDEKLGLEKVLHGLVESPIPVVTANSDIYDLSGLSTATLLNFQEVPESKGSYSSQTASYIVGDIFDNYVELLVKQTVDSSSTTHNYDPTNKRPLAIMQELAIVDDCYFYVDPFDQFIFDENDNMRVLTDKLDDDIVTQLKVVPDFSRIINFFTFKGDDSVPVKVTSEDTTSQNTYYKRYSSEQDKNFADATLAQAYADEVITTYKDPLWRYELQCVPMFGLKVNHKIVLENSKYRIKEHFKIASITRNFTKNRYTIAISLENPPPTIASIFSGYKTKFEKLTKDVQL